MYFSPYSCTEFDDESLDSLEIFISLISFAPHRFNSYSNVDSDSVQQCSRPDLSKHDAPATSQRYTVSLSVCSPKVPAKIRGPSARHELVEVRTNKEAVRLQNGKVRAETFLEAIRFLESDASLPKGRGSENMEKVLTDFAENVRNISNNLWPLLAFSIQPNSIKT